MFLQSFPYSQKGYGCHRSNGLIVSPVFTMPKASPLISKIIVSISWFNKTNNRLFHLRYSIAPPPHPNLSSPLSSFFYLDY